MSQIYIGVTVGFADSSGPIPGIGESSQLPGCTERYNQKLEWRRGGQQEGVNGERESHSCGRLIFYHYCC